MKQFKRQFIFVKKVILISILFLSNLTFSQVKEQELEEIQVFDLSLRLKPKIDFKLYRDDILKRQPEDLGDLLRNVPGISLKNYGGLGGMKTISARGINGTHSGIIVDGFLIQNAQTSQLDLSTIQIENLKELTFTFQNSSENLEVVSAFFTANNLKLTTFENQFSLDTFQLKSNFKIGSFGQTDSYLSTKWNRKKMYLSLFGKYREANGNFPFKVANYSETDDLTRTNNELQEFYSGLSYGYQINAKSRLKFQLLSNFSDKGLPGAVILYNPTANQYLKNKNVTLNGDYIFNIKKTLSRTYLSARYDELIYLDSGYLNPQGYLKSTYFNSNISLGTVFRKIVLNRLKFNFGLEENYSLLKNSENFGTGIQRFHSKVFVDLTKDLNYKWNYAFSLGLQHVYNQQINDTNTYQKFNFNPTLLIFSSSPISFLGTLKFSLKRTFRMPNFNEMYYNQIGNSHLKPEIANQFNIGTNYMFNIKNNILNIVFDGYSNLVENKIVAIPTKNLFIWSIQNVGKARVLGFDLQLSHERDFNNKINFLTSLSYTFQDITDVSDKKSATYRHQLAYLPKHILNANFSFQYKNCGLNVNGYYNSLRYALNENIKSNEVQQFYTFDFSLFFKQKIQKSNLRYSFSVKNCLNQSYSYIRNYAMPGINYLISISYGFN